MMLSKKINNNNVVGKHKNIKQIPMKTERIFKNNI